MMSESLDGGAVTYRSNRHFDMLNENIVFSIKGASTTWDYRNIFEERRTAYGQGLVLLNNTSHDEETLSEIDAVVKAGAPTIKCYMTYREDGLLIEDPDLVRISRRLTESGGMLMLHAEDNEAIEANVPRLVSEGKTAPIFHARSKPPEVETEAIRRIIGMAKETGGRFFCAMWPCRAAHWQRGHSCPPRNLHNALDHIIPSRQLS